MTQERDPQPRPTTLEAVTQLAKETLLREGKHPPTIIAEGSKNSLIMRIPHIGYTHEERMEQMFGAGFMVAAVGEIGDLQQAFFIAEAWMSASQNGKPPTLPPSQDPKRREVLIVSRFQIQSEDVEVIMLEMIRNQKGRLIDAQIFPAAPDKQEMGHSPLLRAFSAGFRAGGAVGLN